MTAHDSTYHDESGLLWLIPLTLVLALNCLPLLIGLARVFSH